MVQSVLKMQRDLCRGFQIILLIILAFGSPGWTKKTVKVGGIFHPGNYDQQVAFKYSIDRANMYNHKINLVPIIQVIPEGDSFQAEKTACQLVSRGVAAIFGPSSHEARDIVRSICQTVEIPCIQNSWNKAVPLPREEDSRSMELNFYPDTATLSTAFAAMITDYDWTSYTILYEDNDSLVRLQEILKLKRPYDMHMRLRELVPFEDNRPLFKEIKATGEVHFILDCHPDHLLEYLRQANDVNLMGDYQNYFITSLDAHTVDLAELKYALANITTLRMIDPDDPELKTAANDWEQGEIRNGKPADIQPGSILLSTALMNDAINHLLMGISELDSSQGINTRPLFCGNQSTWENGFGLVQYMKVKPSNGLSGAIQFDETGQRAKVDFKIVELAKARYHKIGSWNIEEGVTYDRDEGDISSIISEKWQNKTFVVTSKILAPFLYMRQAEEGEVLYGNDRFEGYSMDLIKLIADIMGIQFRFELVEDGANGGYDAKTKQWNGLIRELLEHRADLAICDLTVTYERRTAVDFTPPFMTMGISILFSKAVTPEPDLFSFLNPLSSDVWFCMATSYLGVSIVQFILARLSQREWRNPHPCNEEPEELENTLTFVNCLWMTMGSLLQQGSDIMPAAVGTRLNLGSWWFFTLIMISSYTANLAAFLTNERMENSISNAEDLAEQTKITYGTVLGGSTYSFFKETNITTYKKLWMNMETNKASVFVKSNDEGKERVLKGKNMYAFFMESTSIEYETERNCDLMQVGDQLDNKGYGIAMPQNSPYRKAVNAALLSLQAQGKLKTIKRKWWKEMYGGGACKDDKGGSGDDTPELGIDNVGGVFIVLCCGCAFAIFISFIEFIWHVRQVSVSEKVPYWEAFVAEVKFSIDFRIKKKPIKTTSTESTSTSRRSSSNSFKDENKVRKRKGTFEVDNSLMGLDQII